MAIMKVKQNNEWIDVNSMLSHAHTHTTNDIINFQESIPVKVAADGYTDVIGLRKPINIMFVKSDSTITANVTLQGGKTSTSVVTIGENGRPSTIVTDGIECPIGWEGF